VSAQSSQQLELLSSEATQLGLIVEPAAVHALLDSCILIYLRDSEEGSSRGPETIGGYSRPDIFVRELGRRGALGICYPTLYEVLDPRKGQPLSAALRKQMYERLQLLNRFNIKVLDVSAAIFRRALDLWFDARQGKTPPKHDPGLVDSIIAATALVSSLRLYSANERDFLPFVKAYLMNFASVRVQKPGNYLSL
jgi:predicted nucleic acid-binding protein